MPLPELNVPFTPSSQEEIRDQMLADFRLEAINTTGVDPAVQPGTDNWWWATSHAATGMLQYSNIALSRDAITPLNATGQDLEDWRIALGLAEVKPSPATGKIVLTVTGSATVNDGEPLLLQNGLRAQVVGTFVGVTDGSEIDVATVDTGDAANQEADTEIRFVSAPTNVSEKAKVSRGSPLTGGAGEESEDRKRTRVLNAIANKPGGGNWADFREQALEALGSVQDAYVYPALGGPSSVKVVPVVALDPDNNRFTRVLSDAGISIVRNRVFSKMPDGMEIVVEAAADESVDVAVAVTIPSSSLTGGSGQGWTDQTPWPPLDGGDTRVRVSSVSSSTIFVVDASTTTSPIANQTHLCWWSPVDCKFRTFLIIAVGGGTGAWVITLEKPAVSDDGTAIAVGDFVSPGMVNAEVYGKSWIASMNSLGPYENTSDANRTPRALRHPYIADERPAALSFLMLKALQTDHPEISDIEWSYRSATAPTIPASVADPVNIFAPNHFGIYPQ